MGGSEHLEGPGSRLRERNIQGARHRWESRAFFPGQVVSAEPPKNICLGRLFPRAPTLSKSAEAERTAWCAAPGLGLCSPSSSNRPGPAPAQPLACTPRLCFPGSRPPPCCLPPASRAPGAASLSAKLYPVSDVCMDRCGALAGAGVDKAGLGARELVNSLEQQVGRVRVQ